MKTRNAQRPGMWSNILYTLRVSWRYDKLLFALMAAEAFTGVLMPLVAAFFPKLVIDLLTTGAPARRIVIVVGGFTLICVVVYAAFRFAENAKYMRYNGLRQFFLREIFLKFITCDYEKVESAKGQAMYARAMNVTTSGDASGISRMIPAIVQLATGTLSFLVFSAVLATLHPLIVALLTLASILNYLLLRGV